MTKTERKKVSDVLKQYSETLANVERQRDSFHDLAVKAMKIVEEQRQLIAGQKRPVNVVVILPTPDKEV
jgi:hypothetical protein